jgi:TRAP transporter TAXI family solute receptor
MQKKHLLVSWIAGLMAIAFLMVFCGPVGAYELPKTIYWAAADPPSSLYITPATIAEKIAPVLGVKIRLIPGNDAERLNLMRAGRAQLAAMAADNYWATMGLANYARLAVGPQPLRMIWPGLPYGAGSTGLATKVSGIQTPYDVKGKRAAKVIGAAWSEKGIEAILAFGNLTWDDIEVYEVSSTGAAYKALATGKVDFTCLAATAPGTYEAEASPTGVTIMRFPHDDVEAWKRMNQVMPYWLKLWSTKGATIKEGEKVPTPIYPYPITNTLASQSDDFVYAICKAIYQKIDEIAAAYPSNEALRPDRIIPEASIMAPFHPGAIKFFKEIGVWTDAHEKYNNLRLAQLKKVNERWAAYLEEAQERVAKTKKKVDVQAEWTKIVKDEIGLRPW